MQFEAASLPAGELDPEGQLLHATAPDSALYDPVGHTLHVPPLKPVKPALHVQSEAASLPAGELDPAGQLLHAPTPDEILNLPEGQLLQTSAPGSALNVPAAQGAHGPPSGPVKPALHVQADREELPAGESEF